MVDAGEPQQRQRVGDRDAARCRITIARSSSARRRSARRSCSRCTASAAGAGLALTTGALLHAERPDDSASVGRHLRRVSHLHAARSGRRASSTTPTRAEAHRRGPQGLQRRRHRARQVHGRRRIEGFNPTRFGRLLYARQEFANFAEQFTRGRRHAARAHANKNKKPIARGFVVDDAMVADFRVHDRRPRRSRSTRTASRRTTTFIRAMIHFEIDIALFGMAEARRNLIAKDPQAQFALGAVRRGARS